MFVTYVELPEKLRQKQQSHGRAATHSAILAPSAALLLEGET